MDPDRARELLRAERTRLERALRQTVREDDSEPGLDDNASLAPDLFQDEMNEGLRDDFEQQLAAVGRAEDRLAAGTYGLSVRSGLPIPDARLEALPAAELTIEEERADEGR